MSRQLQLKDRGALQELLATYSMFKSSKQQEALKTNASLQAYAEAVETMMDAFGIDEECLREIVKNHDEGNNAHEKFEVVSRFSRPIKDETHQGKSIREVGYRITVPEDQNDYTFTETMNFLDSITGS